MARLSKEEKEQELARLKIAAAKRKRVKSILTASEQIRYVLGKIEVGMDTPDMWQAIETFARWEKRKAMKPKPWEELEVK